MADIGRGDCKLGRCKLDVIVGAPLVAAMRPAVICRLEVPQPPALCLSGKIVS